MSIQGHAPPGFVSGTLGHTHINLEALRSTCNDSRHVGYGLVPPECMTLHVYDATQNTAIVYMQGSPFITEPPMITFPKRTRKSDTSEEGGYITVGTSL